MRVRFPGQYMMQECVTEETLKRRDEFLSLFLIGVRIELSILKTADFSVNKANSEVKATNEAVKYIATSFLK